jgi:SAM-dependent methyltransferase
MTPDAFWFDASLTSADERRRFLDLLSLPPFARLIETAADETWADGAFDGVLCVDGIARVADRARVLSAWARGVKPGGRILYTDPAIVAGLVTSDEIAALGAMGPLVLSPQGENEFLIEGAGLRLLRADDATDDIARTAEGLLKKREGTENALVAAEGRDLFTAKQRFLRVTQRLAAERRLVRIAFLLEKSP